MLFLGGLREALFIAFCVEVDMPAEPEVDVIDLSGVTLEASVAISSGEGVECADPWSEEVSSWKVKSLMVFLTGIKYFCYRPTLVRRLIETKVMPLLGRVVGNVQVCILCRVYRERMCIPCGQV